MQSERRAGGGGAHQPLCITTVHHHCASPLYITTVHHHCAYESCSVAQYLLTAQLLNTCSLADANNQLKANANEMNSMRSQLKLALGELAGQEGGDAGHKVRHTD